MRLSELLTQDTIDVNFSAPDKWAAITGLVDLLVERGRLAADKRQAVLDVIFERERSVTTGMERGIAIPHANSTEVDDVLGAFGIAKEGIEFESLDGQPAFLIILIVIPKAKFQQHVRTLAGIARLLNHGDVVEAFRKCTSAEAAMTLIREEEASDRL